MLSLSTLLEGKMRPVRPETGGYHHGNLRESLIQAALDELAESGSADISLRKVANRAGVSSAAPYRHFKTRESLLYALSEHGFMLLNREMAAAVGNHPSRPWKQLLSLSEAYLSMAERQSAFFRIMFGPYSEADPDLDKAGVPRACDDSYAGLVAIFRKAIADGHFHKGPAESMALTYWAMLHGFSSLMIEGKLDGIRAKKGESLIPTLQ